ncbi:SulP family inorganic anion transporter [Ochrovirga pacifica]|uniref:SulP family inorganic anion transporter n=1 Tax=Ochrovirga pacifica TaxID=1042376 RepID=UPI000255A28E|nr:solute carrier family 26 protein [Ochrovirga pacifica]
MKRYFPFTTWVSTYKKSDLYSDVMAGVTVGILLIPQGMAYALVAGLPPVYGLYAALMPQIVYAFLGTSKQLSVGPVAMDSLMVAAGLGALQITGLENYITMALFLALFMGAVQLLLGVLKMGFLVNFLSKPVISGFTSAAALVIGLSQLKHVFGISIQGSSKVHEVIVQLWQGILGLNVTTLAIGSLAMVIIVISKRYFSRIPSALIVVVVGIVVVRWFALQEKGVAVIGEIPSGLPSFQWISFSSLPVVDLIPLAITLALVAFMEAISISKSLEDKETNYKVDPSQELIALGMANIMGSLFQAYPTTGGFSRTAVNNQSGAKTLLASWISALVVGVILLFFTSLFYDLPKAVLGAMILVAVVNLFDVSYPIKLWRQHKDEFFLLLATFLITLFFGITQGILVGVIASLLLLIYRTSQPHIAVLARIGDSNYFKNISRFDKVNQRKDLLILRFDAQLFFGNKDYFREKLDGLIAKQKTTLKAIILNAEAITYIDNSANAMLLHYIEGLQQRGIKLFITGAIGPTRDVLFKAGVVDLLGKENLFVRTYEAVDCYDGIVCKDDLQREICHQNTHTM